jgi:arylsulfatase A-like enzyme
MRLLFLVFCFSITLCQAKETRPNVIFFAVDDMNDWIEPFGSDMAKTPNLKRLADMGVTFKNGHTAGVFCAPSRAAIFTGRYATTSGCYENNVYFYDHPEYVPLQKTFHDAGYSTFGTGKLFHHPEGLVDQRGWTEFHLRTEEQRKNGWPMDSWEHGAPLPDPVPHSKFNQVKNSKKSFMEAGSIPNHLENHTADAMRTDWACEIISKQHDDPFFVGVGLYAPHYPNYAPQKYFDLYPLDEIKLPTIKEDDIDDLPEKVQKRLLNRKKVIYDELVRLGTMKKQVQAYLACISFADAMLGRVLDALEKSPNKDNTVIVFWSDHGYALGEKWQWGKHTLWQKTSNVPFLWAGPGIQQGQVTNSTVSLIDMYPTLIDLCGIRSNEPLEGQSLKNILKNPTARHGSRTVLLPYDEPNSYALINETWRYIKYSDDTEELYNVVKDPHEWENLASSPDFREVINNLQEHAPKSFAPMGTIVKNLELVIDGENYHWQPKKKKKKRKK